MGENRRQAVRVLSVLYRPSRYWVFFPEAAGGEDVFPGHSVCVRGIFWAALITPCRPSL